MIKDTYEDSWYESGKTKSDKDGREGPSHIADTSVKWVSYFLLIN